MTEEEVRGEVEALQAVYGDDCIVLNKYPPHFHLHIRPRTADISSQQFVEAVISMQAGTQYPDKQPHIIIVDSKGLNEQKQKHLIDGILQKACELSSCLMLVALCEEAVERLSSMNQPDGDCPLCLYPLVDEDTESKALPFMKLMSCYHCFHCECIIRWWNWLRVQKDTGTNKSSGTSSLTGDTEDQQAAPMMEDGMGSCPVCRKVFHSKDIKHVLDLVGSHSKVNPPKLEVGDEDEPLQSEMEKMRRQKFHAIWRIQQGTGGLIEPKKHEVLLPGMFLSRPVSPATRSDKDTTHQKQKALIVSSETNSSSSSYRPSRSEPKNINTKKYRGHNFRREPKQYVRKDTGAAN